MTPKEIKYLLSCGSNPLELSISKWADIYNGVGKDAMNLNCALCISYRNYHINDERSCIHCPVMIKTGKAFCKGTPYDEYAYSAYKCWDEEIELKEIALIEMQFLQSLRD